MNKPWLEIGVYWVRPGALETNTNSIAPVVFLGQTVASLDQGGAFPRSIDHSLLVAATRSITVNCLSLTLRDAEHLCWKNFRKINDTIDAQRGKGWTPFVMVTDLLEEAGEVAAAVKGLEGFKPPEKPKTKEMLAIELSNLLYMIFVLAAHYGIDVEEAFVQNVNDRIISSLH